MFCTIFLQSSSIFESRGGGAIFWLLGCVVRSDCALLGCFTCLYLLLNSLTSSAVCRTTVHLVKPSLILCHFPLCRLTLDWSALQTMVNLSSRLPWRANSKHSKQWKLSAGWVTFDIFFLFPGVELWFLLAIPRFQSQAICRFCGNLVNLTISWGPFWAV